MDNVTRLRKQITKDAALVAAWPESKRRFYERQLRATFINPGITFGEPSNG